RARGFGRGEAAVHLGDDGSDDGRRIGEHRSARRRQHCRARLADRLCRPARDRADREGDAAGRLSTRGVPAREGRARHDRGPAKCTRPDRVSDREADAPAHASGYPGRFDGLSSEHLRVPQSFASLAEWLAWLETLHPKKIDMSLDRIHVVLDALGIRPPPYRVITVGGTNGKGSCVAILESIYRQAGYRVGAFTSPHLVRFNERVRFDGADASDQELIALFESIDASLGAVTLSYFEASTVAAFLHFERCRADVAVLEVGMGGRVDAVNALDADAALIASIGLDHTDWLGPDREAIGHEKAGIMRAGRPVVVGDADPPASLARHAEAVGAKLATIHR